MKKRLFLALRVILLLFSLSIFTACEFPNMGVVPKLLAPSVTLNDDIASWNKIDNAIRYELALNNEIFSVDVNTNSYILKDSECLSVRAVGDGINYISSDWSNTVTYEEIVVKPDNDKLGQQIEKEYQALVNGTTTIHTTWTFTGIILDMSATYYNGDYANYCVKMVVDVDGVLIGIYNGFTSGTYPTDISGLSEGKEITVTGQISEGYTLTSGSFTANIEFKNPEISWKKDVNSDDNNNNDNDNIDNNDKKSTNVNFLMINDTHGAFVDTSSGYSIGRVDTLVDELTAQNGDYILIHNGDAFQGSYVCSTLYGLPLVEAFNQMNFDCFVLGNHEFDWGIDKIAAYADGNPANGEANFPFLGANIYYKGTSTRPNWIDAYTVVEYGDLKVGIIGVMGETHETSILTKYVADYDFVNPINIIKEHATTLRTTLDCDVVVVASHDYDETLNSKIASLSGNAEIDAIFCAHTHQQINQTLTRSDGEKIAVVQNTHKNNLASEVIIELDDNGEYGGFKNAFYSPSRYAISSDITTVINKYQYLIDEADESLGTVNSYLNKSTLGNYATDAMLNWNYEGYDFGGIDITIINTAGIRATISSGEITRADVFEVFPFNNTIVLVNMSGKDLKSLCKKNSSYLYIGVSKEIGSYSQLNDNTIYQLAVIDYVFEGTYYTEFDKLSKNDYIETSIVLRDQLIEYLDDLY